MLILLYGEGGFYLNIGWGVGADDMERGGAPLRGGGRYGGTQFNIATIVGQGGVQHHGGAVSRYEDGGAPPGGGGGI